MSPSLSALPGNRRSEAYGWLGYEFFRNPVDPATGRRNDGPLEFPTSPVFLGRQFCPTSSDGNRRDNFPNTGGEVAGKGKISRLDQPLDVPAVPLPVR